mgnify:CR=1 FL=1
MRKILALTLFSLLTLNLASAQEIFDLKKSVSTAFANSLVISQIQNNINIQEFNVKSSWGDLIPTLNLNGQFSRNNTYSSGGTVYQNGLPITLSDSKQAINNWQVGMNSSVTLFNGLANYENVNLQKKNLSNLYLNLENEKYNIVLQVYQKFFDVIKKDKIVEVNKENLQVSINQLNQIKEYVAVGKKTQSDIYKQDVQVAQNELSVLSSENEYKKSKVEFLNTLNDDVTKSISLEYGSIYIPITISELQAEMGKYADFEALMKNAVKNRFDYKYAEEDIKLNEIKLSIARKNLYFPTLSAFANASISGNEIYDIDNNKVFTYGLTLSYPIFQGFKTDVNKQISEVNIKQKQDDLSKLEKNIRTEIKKSLFDLETAYKQIEILEKNIKASEQDKLLSEENFRIGYGTLLDVQVATSNLNKLLIDRINYIYNFVLTQKYIEYLSGILKY